MIKQMSNNLASFLFINNQIKEEHKELYSYGFEFMISTGINFFIMLMFALVMSTFAETLVFIIAFFLLRGSTGGYHAESHFSCQILSILVYLVNMTVVLIIHGNSLLILSVCMTTFISIIVIYMFAPLVHNNRLLNEREYHHFKSRSRINSITLFAIFIIGIGSSFHIEKLCIAGMMAIITVAFSIIISEIKGEKNEKSCKKIQYKSVRDVNELRNN